MLWKVTTVLKFYMFACCLPIHCFKTFSNEPRNPEYPKTNVDWHKELPCARLCLVSISVHFPCLCSSKLINEISLIWKRLSEQFTKNEHLENVTPFDREVGKQEDSAIVYQSSLANNLPAQKVVANQNWKRNLGTNNVTKNRNTESSYPEFTNKTAYVNEDAGSDDRMDNRGEELGQGFSANGTSNGGAGSGTGSANGTSNGGSGSGDASGFGNLREIWDHIKNYAFINWKKIIHAVLTCDLDELEAYKFYFPNATFSGFNCTNDATTTTTTENPIEKFCRQACLSGNGGASCGCAQYPIG